MLKRKEDTESRCNCASAGPCMLSGTLSRESGHICVCGLVLFQSKGHISQEYSISKQKQITAFYFYLFIYSISCVDCYFSKELSLCTFFSLYIYLVCLVSYLHITSKRKFTLALEVSDVTAVWIMNEYLASCLYPS